MNKSARTRVRVVDAPTILVEDEDPLTGEWYQTGRIEPGWLPDLADAVLTAMQGRHPEEYRRLVSAAASAAGFLVIDTAGAVLHTFPNQQGAAGGIADA